MQGDKERVDLDLAKRVYQLETIQDVGLEINSSHDTQTIVGVILQSVLGTLGSTRGAILLFDQDTGKLTVHTSKGLEGEQVTFKLTKGIVEWMVKTSLPFILGELEDGKVKRFFERNKTKIKAVSAQVWTPLIAKETLLGVIVLGSKLGKKGYTPDDVSFLTTISGQAAQALENARSYQLIDAARRELDKKLYEQSTLYEVSRSLIGTLDLDVLIYQTLLMSIGIIGCRAGSIMLQLTVLKSLI